MFSRAWVPTLLLTCCVISPVCGEDLRAKMGVYLTPASAGDSRFAVEYSEAIHVLEGNASTVWILESWRNIEIGPGQFDWQVLDEKVRAAKAAGFSIGLRIQIVLCGNDSTGTFVAVSRIPTFYSQDMRSPEFSDRVTSFFRRLAERYRGKAKYIAVGNTVNRYFEKHRSQWGAFRHSYNAIVDAVHEADPSIFVVSDIAYGADFYTHRKKMKKYLDFFSQSHDDVTGVVFYFIEKVFYGKFSNFNLATLQSVLDELHALSPRKKLYLLETAVFSTNPKNGRDISVVQARYVHMLLTAAKKSEYITGVCWWLLYDARDLPDISWDLKATFGLFDSTGQPKRAWDVWKTAYAQD